MLATQSNHSLSRGQSIWRRLSRRDRNRPTPPNDDAAPQRLQKRSKQPVATGAGKSNVVTHLQRIDVPNTPTRGKAPPTVRATASQMQTTSFPNPASSIHTVPWNVFLTPDQVYRLVMGFAPEMMEDKWFIYSQGPDRTGKLKVHFHRSWTGMKIAELFVVIDLKGEGAGKIVGIKWNGSDQTNGLNEEEAKYMIATTCEWVLDVDMQNGLA